MKRRKRRKRRRRLPLEMMSGGGSGIKMKIGAVKIGVKIGGMKIGGMNGGIVWRGIANGGTMKRRWMMMMMTLRSKRTRRRVNRHKWFYHPVYAIALCHRPERWKEKWCIQKGCLKLLIPDLDIYIYIAS